MKCMYLEKECVKDMPCPSYIKSEIDYLRKKVKNLESRNNVKEGSITITKEELFAAQAEALARLSLVNPALFIIHDELSKAAALTAAILFGKKEE